MVKSKVDDQKMLELIAQGYSDSEVAKVVGTSRSNIAARRRKYGITKELNQQDQHQLNYFKYYNIFEDQQTLSALIGTLLGDSWLTFSSERSYRGGCSHCFKQLCYLQYKKELLSSIVTSDDIKLRNTKRQILNGNIIEPSVGYNIAFKASPYLKQLHSILYSKDTNKKIITTALLDHFTVLSLALFYMDDGYKYTISKTGTTYYRIVNYDFDESSRKLFAEFLKDKFDLNCKVYSNCFEFYNKEGIKFINLIKEYIPECMKYKI